MLFNGPLVRKVANIDPGLISAVVELVDERYSSKWLVRTKLDIGTKVLKIIAPMPNVDLLEPADQSALLSIVSPLLSTIPVNDNEMICYADISNLLPGSDVKLHIDNLWLHVLSKRYHIPLKTNKQTNMGFLITRDSVVLEHMPVGAVYEINNTHPHAVRNNGNEERWHLIVDVIDKSTMKFIEHNWMDSPISPSINWMWGDISYYSMNKALS